MVANAATVRPAPRAHARRRFVCVGFCGGGTAPFRAWVELLPEDTELVLICYPGREGRYNEPHAATWSELAADTTAAVRSVADRPYTLYGHSMGGWMAFDVAGRVPGAQAPESLVVSSCNAPHLGVTDRDRFPARENTDAELVEWMCSGGLLPEYVHEDPELVDMAIDLMRADIAVRDTYRFNPHRPTTALPTQVLYGADDPMMYPHIAADWQAMCTGPLTVTRVPGGHFFTPGTWRTLPRLIDPPHDHVPALTGTG